MADWLDPYSGYLMNGAGAPVRRVQAGTGQVGDGNFGNSPLQWMDGTSTTAQTPTNPAAITNQQAYTAKQPNPGMGYSTMDANLGMGAPSGAPGPAEGGGNPYLGLQGGAIARRMTDNLQRTVLPQISQYASAGGGYGGSRQGVLEANAIKDMNLGLGDSLAGLYGGDWAQQQNRQLSRYGMDQGFYTAQRGQDLQSVGLGADLISKGQQGQWTGIQGATGAYSPFTGLGNTTQSGNTGGGFGGAVGGALGAAQFAKNAGWWPSSVS